MGLFLYLVMLLTVIRAVRKLPLLERRFALVLLATLFTAMLPLTWEDRKSVWLVLGALVGLAQAYPREMGSTARAGHTSHSAPVPGARPRPRPLAPLRVRAEEARPDSPG